MNEHCGIGQRIDRNARGPRIARRSAALAVVAVGVLGAAGCASLTEESETIRGTVSYRQKVAMPPDAVLLIRLVDLTLTGTNPPVLASRTFSKPGQVPFLYELSYQPSKLRPEHRYGVQAWIESAGKPWMVTATVNHVMHFGRIARADVMLKPAPLPAPE